MSAYKVASFFAHYRNGFSEDIPNILTEVGVDTNGLYDAIRNANRYYQKAKWVPILVTIVVMLVINGIYFGIVVAANGGFDKFGSVYQPWWSIGLGFGIYYGVHWWGFMRKAKNCIMDLNQKSNGKFHIFWVRNYAKGKCCQIKSGFDVTINSTMIDTNLYKFDWSSEIEQYNDYHLYVSKEKGF